MTFKNRINTKWGVIVHRSVIPATLEAEAGRLSIGGQAGLHSENSSQKKKKKSSQAAGVAQWIARVPA
jgi:hypothetical protein